MGYNKIALVGATGNVGPAIHKALLDGGFDLTILSREGSTSTDSLPSHPNQKITKVNFDDVNSIAAALKGIEAVVSNVASHALPSQKKIIDAAIAAGVKRFLPSDFGADLDLEIGKSVPFNMPKVDVHNYLDEVIKSHPEFSYTSVANGPFFDWCLRMGVWADFKNHDATLWDGGDTKVSSTTLAGVGKTVVGVLKNPEAAKNRTVRVAETTITQKEIIELVKEIDGKEWTTKVVGTAEGYEGALEELKKPEPNIMATIMPQLFRIMFAPEYEPSYEGKLDNDKFGLAKLSRDQVKEVIKNNLP